MDMICANWERSRTIVGEETELHCGDVLAILKGMERRKRFLDDLWTFVEIIVMHVAGVFLMQGMGN